MAVNRLNAFAVAVLHDEDDIRRRYDDEHEKRQPEDDHHQEVSLMTAFCDRLRCPPQVEIPQLSMRFCGGTQQ